MAKRKHGKRIMKKTVLFILMVGLLIGLVSCGKAGSASNVSRSDLIGDWVEYSDDGITQYVTLTEDGRYISESVSSMGFTLNAEHTWTYIDGVFTVNYEDYGTTSVYKKVTLDGDTLTIDNGTGKIVYKRN